MKQETVMLKIGCHLSTEDGYLSMGKRILALGGTTFQYFTKNPRGRSKPKQPSEGEIGELLALIAEHGMTMPLAHAPYTYNPCSADEEVRRYTRESMHSELDFLERLPGSLYNFHPGCHVGQGLDVGIGYIAETLDSAMWSGMKTTVLLETMAGKGTEIGSHFEELRMIIDRVDPAMRDNVNVCLDTCHVNDAGYDIIGDLDGVLREFDRCVGIDRLRAIHLNDSMNPCDSHKDRHAKIGEGTIGFDAIRRIINNPALKNLPFYLETPNDEDGYAREIAMLKEAYDG